MTALGWIMAGLALLIVVRLGKRGRPNRTHLPGDFNFDGYKTREIVQRGVFDKTKWR
ncbi:hypothetical protein [Desulfovibrio sp. TomC]|uniref:hypothetical protein n=1 Tax=Desulfovibrio sp. TomC TaxID=1562888 RepID=UPI0005740ACE|nr:hypothetical protein [Desulfovibrio sp. TomC]KHK04168.1 hypothetical protein NY78_0612 [Desulfovibrio sp. TomC]